ncbi:MAG: nodulation protein NfeD [Burkholderiaceae bacterium]
MAAHRRFGVALITGWLVCAVGLLGAVLGLAVPDAARAQGGEASIPGLALQIDVDGAIGPATVDHVMRALATAQKRQASVLVLRLDTPGGLDTSMREIVRAIVASPVPVLAYVAPSGARAASAGTFILYASHVAAMAPGTNLGAATPVSIGGSGWPASPRQPGADGDGQPAQRGTERGADSGAQPGAQPGANARPGTGAAPVPVPGSAGERKAINDAVAYLRALAEMRGRSADWAEAAVREAASLPASQAQARGVIDLVARSVDDLLQQADGRVVLVGETRQTLRTRGLAVERLEADWRTRLLGVLANPNLAMILMMIGLYGLVFEFMNPGSLLPGTVGAISLLVALYALSALPVNYAGVLLILLGLGMMVAEAFTASLGVLGIGGAIAFLIGATILIDADVPEFSVSWPLAGAVAVTALLMTLIVMRAALRARGRRVVSGREAMVGGMGRVLSWQGGRGHVLADGVRWQAESQAPLVAGQPVRILAVHDLTLAVAPDGPHDRAAESLSAVARDAKPAPPAVRADSAGS